MSLFKKHDNVDKVGKLAKKNAKEIRRVETEDLVEIKHRQDVIERRLAILQQELDVQVAQRKL